MSTANTKARLTPRGRGAARRTPRSKAPAKGLVKEQGVSAPALAHHFGYRRPIA